MGDPTAQVAQLQAMNTTNCTGVVRVPWNDRVHLKRVLDPGVEGVMSPSVDTAEGACAAVTACHYPRRGRRGAASSSARASGYGMSGGDYVNTCGDNLLVIVQIGSAKAVENIDAIRAVEDVDLVFIGSRDLSGTVGQLGN